MLVYRLIKYYSHTGCNSTLQTPYNFLKQTTYFAWRCVISLVRPFFNNSAAITFFNRYLISHTTRNCIHALLFLRSASDFSRLVGAVCGCSSRILLDFRISRAACSVIILRTSIAEDGVKHPTLGQRTYRQVAVVE